MDNNAEKFLERCMTLGISVSLSIGGFASLSDIKEMAEREGLNVVILTLSEMEALDFLWGTQDWVKDIHECAAHGQGSVLILDGFHKASLDVQEIAEKIMGTKELNGVNLQVDNDFPLSVFKFVN